MKELQIKQAMSSANRNIPLKSMLGAGRVNFEDNADIDTAMGSLIEFNDGAIPMQDNVYYRYGK